jgi:DNA-binding LacI/PurR family transcriptional regulator
VRAGVSTQTVSRVADQHENVSPATRVKVLAEMRALGYRPKLAARALVTGRFGALGVARSDDVPGVRSPACAPGCSRRGRLSRCDGLTGAWPSGV